MITLGIDIGGSATKGALVDTENGSLVSERIRKVTRGQPEPQEVVRLILEICRKLEYSGPIGAGFPGVVKRGVVITAANLHKDWVGKDVARLITHACNQPAVVLNDADAAGLAEMRFGSQRAREAESVLFLTLGTGIGSALFVKGQLFPNTEFGHLAVNGVDAEQIASAAVKRLKNLTWRQWACRFDEVLHAYEALLNPELIVLGGGISSRFEKFSRYLTVNTPVIPAELENLAGIVGGAMAAQESFNLRLGQAVCDETD